MCVYMSVVLCMTWTGPVCLFECMSVFVCVCVCVFVCVYVCVWWIVHIGNIIKEIIIHDFLLVSSALNKIWQSYEFFNILGRSFKTD